MFNRIQYSALALSAVIVAAGLGATDASARGGGFGGFRGGGGFGGGFAGRSFGGGFAGRSFGGGFGSRSFGGGGFGRGWHNPGGGGETRTVSNFHPTRFPPVVPYQPSQPIQFTPPSNAGPGHIPVNGPPLNPCFINPGLCKTPPGPPPGPPMGPGKPPGPPGAGNPGWWPVVWKHHPHWWIGAYPVAMDTPMAIADPVVADPAVGGPAIAQPGVNQAAAAPCNCLTKQYLP